MKPRLIECLQGYNRETFMNDLLAGIIVGIVALPLAIAFGIANKFDELMTNIGRHRPRVRIIRMRKVPFIDSTGIHNLQHLIEMNHEDGIHVILSGVSPKVHSQLQRAGFYSLMDQDHICPHIDVALQKARDFLGTGSVK